MNEKGFELVVEALTCGNDPIARPTVQPEGAEDIRFVEVEVADVTCTTGDVLNALHEANLMRRNRGAQGALDEPSFEYKGTVATPHPDGYPRLIIVLDDHNAQ